ncbi:beta-N-acetylhexosaminidase [Melghirimyces profundicolus]|uniref:beta-N-acetylhexosaminidase n=1 Tax=Melghirimyces profundicolus TaxID=1242148 RepID=A0A2T6BGJ6_9BACL|nr:beta-N-acetylhexosaminidase [Melghirimyces profundicolus]PTX55188.1 beta-N-acetylhexosaminidase [Melghirimyces profundicolus]
MAPFLRGLFIAVLSFSILVLPSSRPGNSGTSADQFLSKGREGIEGAIDRIIGEMTPEEKVGQLFMVGFHNGEQPAFEMNPQIRTLIRDEKVGSVILFDRNLQSPRQVAELTNDMQRLALSGSLGLPLLISIDQEGGKVVRMREGVTVFPGGMALGAAGDPSITRLSGRVVGSELRAMGINMNLAPVLDVNNNPKNPVIGARSFASDPKLVAWMASAQIRGYHDGTVLTVAKHFPGHGDTATDSHVDLPAVPHSLDRLNRVELVPFKEVLDETDAVMSAHITFPAIEGTPGLPGTLSKKVLTGLLRERLGFKGVIITDDMEMGAIVDRFGAEEAAVRAIKSGADIVLVSHDLSRQQASIRAVREAVAKGEISEERIDRSLRRILRLKMKRMGGTSVASQPLVPTENIRERVGTKENGSAAEQAARAALTLVRDPQHRLPLNPSQSKQLLVVSSVGAEPMGSFFSDLGFSVRVRTLDTDPGPDDIREVTKQAAGVDSVIIGTTRAEANQGQAELIRRLEAGGIPVIALGLDTPYEVKALPDSTPYLALYSATPESLKAAAEALVGETPIRGKLPVEIPGRYPVGHGLKR